MKSSVLRNILLVAGVFTLAYMPAPASAASGACAPAQVKYAVSEDPEQFTNSTLPPKNIEDAKVTFKQTIDGGCVIVRFSARTFSTDSEVLIGPVMDKLTHSLPKEVIYSGFDVNDTARAYSFEFIFENVPAGNHAIQMQFRSTAGHKVFVNDHTMVVQY